ncbi:Uncharacterised protein [uncultured archaeon]|nr:Uncharacterised protein [uncultured archaeon]
MVNEEIVTALKNAIDHGESLDSAVNVMINSGYGPKDVQEASDLIGGGTLSYLQPKPEENFTTPSQKGFFGNFAKKPVQQVEPQQQPMPMVQQGSVQPPQQQFQRIQAQQSYIQQNPNAIKQNISSGAVMPSYPQTQPMQPQQTMQPVQTQYSQQTNNSSNQDYTKEIFLLIILLILLGVLISTILFKESILQFIQNFSS